jgi:hypothetical protein
MNQPYKSVIPLLNGHNDRHLPETKAIDSLTHDAVAHTLWLHCPRGAGVSRLWLPPPGRSSRLTKSRLGANYKAVLEVDNPERLLRPGMTATLEVAEWAAASQVH